MSNSSYNSCVVIKVGGSVITRKEGEVDVNNAQILAEEIAEYGRDMVIVHGGGSVIKRMLIRHKVQSDFLSSDQQVVIDNFQTVIRNLNEFILNSLKKVGLRCASVAPHNILTSYDGQIITFDATKITECLEEGIIPVLHSDILEDNVRQYYTCSSDHIASQLAKVLGPKMVLFLTDADGVYEDYPAEADQAKPRQVVDSSFLTCMRHNYKVGGSDMYGKVKHAIACSLCTKLCCILNGRVPRNLIDALKGRIQVGTRVTR